jgi:hypothetical protein
VKPSALKMSKKQTLSIKKMKADAKLPKEKTLRKSVKSNKLGRPFKKDFGKLGKKITKEDLEGKETDVKQKRAIFRRLKKVIQKGRYEKYTDINHQYYDFSLGKLEKDKRF